MIKVSFTTAAIKARGPYEEGNGGQILDGLSFYPCAGHYE